MKSKKTLIAIAVAAGVLAIGATIAYNMDSMSFDNIFHTSTYETQSSETFTSPPNWQPCDTTPKSISVKNTGTVDVAVRIKLNQYWKSSNGDDLAMLVDGNNNPLTTINFVSDYADYWEKSGDWYVYKTKLAPNATAHDLFESVTLKCEANLAGDSVYSNNGLTGESGNSDYAGAKFHVDGIVQTIQYDARSEWN